jgi:hypothetical protein
VRASPNMNVTAMRPDASHIGKSDEFERDVIWALGATVPTGNGKWGTAIVTFVVSASGQVEGLRLVKSAMPRTRAKRSRVISAHTSAAPRRG